MNYEYASDNAINPEIKVKSNNGAKINVTKTYKQAIKCYELKFTILELLMVLNLM